MVLLVEEIILLDNRVLEIIPSDHYQKYDLNLKQWEAGPSTNSTLDLVYSGLNNFLASPFIMYSNTLDSRDVNGVKHQIVTEHLSESDSIIELFNNDALRPKQWFFVNSALSIMKEMLTYVGENPQEYLALLSSASDLADSHTEYEPLMGQERIAYAKKLKTEVDSLLTFLST